VLNTRRHILLLYVAANVQADVSQTHERQPHGRFIHKKSFTQLARTQPDLYDNATVPLYLNSPLERAGRVTNQPAMQFEQQLADGEKIYMSGPVVRSLLRVDVS
jgi:hypothetical protein